VKLGKEQPIVMEARHARGTAGLADLGLTPARISRFFWHVLGASLRQLPEKLSAWDAGPR
jgi:hypothetical protein